MKTQQAVAVAILMFFLLGISIAKETTSQPGSSQTQSKPSSEIARSLTIFVADVQHATHQDTSAKKDKAFDEALVRFQAALRGKTLILTSRITNVEIVSDSSARLTLGWPEELPVDLKSSGVIFHGSKVTLKIGKRPVNPIW